MILVIVFWFIISILIALGFSQDKWELKFGNYYYSPIDSTKPAHLTQASIYIDSNQNKDLTFNRIDKSKVDDYLISLSDLKKLLEEYGITEDFDVSLEEEMA